MGADAECVFVFWRVRGVLCPCKWVAIAWSKVSFTQCVFVTSFGCGWYSSNVPQSLNCWSFCNIWGKMGVGRMVGGNGIVMEAVREDGM